MGRERKLTGLDIRHLSMELSSLEGRILKKVYSIDDHTFSLVFYPEVDSCRELIVDINGFAFLTDLKWRKPKVPPPFVMSLRKHLEGKKISSAEQMGMERILLLKLAGRDRSLKLIFELFGGGNIILAENDRIISLLKRAEYRGRTLRIGEIYKPPTRKAMPNGWSVSIIEELLSSEEYLQKPVWKVLVELFGIGPPYLDEISVKLDLDLRNKLSSSKDMISDLARVIWEFLVRETDPVIYIREGVIENFAVFPLKSLPGDLRRTGTLSKAIQLYYTSREMKVPGDSRIISIKKEIERQESLREEYREESDKLKSIGDLIYLHLNSVNEAIKKAREGELSSIVRRIDKRSGIMYVSLNGEEVRLNFLKSASDNATEYYKRAKKLREKYERMEKAISSLKERLRRMEEETEEFRISRLPTKRKRLRWYEKFRWFFTSSGFLVIGGRDAQSNSEIVSKHLDESDLFFHVDMPGGSVVVLKSGEKEPDNDSIHQAAVAAASFSRAWREGLLSADVYYVRGNQVSKHAPHGMYLPKGSFYITGRRNYLRVKLEICVGFQETPDGVKLTSAPADAPFLYSICLRPGSLGKEAAAKMLKNRIEAWLRKNIKIGGVSDVSAEPDINLDDILRVMPPGKVDIME